ncbi:MAG TPA: GDSL-type esterase/lipase family protein [Puia sp.]|jgi:lysophospholipase L1-like esterase|nr:GDSL-type esterase/lipase family protein [Puia sp.]
MNRLLTTWFARAILFEALIFGALHLSAQAPVLSQPSVAAQPPFWNEISEFKRRDSFQHPPANAILFVGSSSFRKWTNVQTDFPGYTIINRGFGGSTFDDLIRYARDIIYPYHPRQVVIYCGDNDLAGDERMTGRKVYKRFLKLYDMIRKHLGNIDIVYVSIKPSPSREKLMPEMEEANDMIRNFMAERSHAAFVDVYHLMLNAHGHPMDELFVSDKLHMNEKGYKIWQQAIMPYLDK